MPDFDTRTPQETNQPSKLKMFVAASKQHISAVASRLRTSARVQLRNKNIIRLLGIGGSILLLVVVAVVAIVWAVLRPADHPAGPPADQLSQRIQTPPTPAYNYLPIDPSKEGESDYECVLVARGYGDTSPPSSYCPVVNTKAADPVKLAAITQQIQGGPIQEDGLEAFALQVEFNRRFEDWWGGRPPQATSYCFIGKDLALDALSGSELDNAELLGKTDDCFVIVYEGAGPEVTTLRTP